VDGLNDFPETIAAVLPKARVQLCLVQMVRDSLNFVGGKAALNRFTIQFDEPMPRAQLNRR
jgi:transposase-like protein